MVSKMAGAVQGYLSFRIKKKHVLQVLQEQHPGHLLG